MQGFFKCGNQLAATNGGSQIALIVHPITVLLSATSKVLFTLQTAKENERAYVRSHILLT